MGQIYITDIGGGGFTVSVAHQILSPISERFTYK